MKVYSYVFSYMSWYLMVYHDKLYYIIMNHGISFISF